MKKVIYSTLITLYAIIAVFSTVCLLSYNDYKISEFGDYSLVIIPEDGLNDNLKKGDLVIVNKKSEIKVGDQMFFYNTYSKDMSVTLAEVKGVEQVTKTEATYTIDGDMQLSSQYVLGPVNGCVKIAFVGTVLSIIESQWGFLFLIVFPSLIAFIYEITVVVSEIRGTKNKEEK